MMRTPSNSEPASTDHRLRRFGADVAASGDELREFLQQCRGKSPQEVLGLVAQSGLVRATCTAAVGCVILVAVFTILPFAWGRTFGRTASTARAAATGKPAQQSEDVPSGEASAAAPERGPKPGSAADTPAAHLDAAGQPPPTGSEAILEKLNMDSEAVDPNVNPLEDTADDLLDDLK